MHRAKMAFAAVILCLCAPTFAGEITLGSLLDEMVDRQALARFPDPAYTCAQASSYDRASVERDGPGWFANSDHSHYIRSETNGGREEWVLMDAKGPGCVSRFWITGNNYKGIVRIYLDGAEKPVVAERVDLLIGGEALAPAPFSAERSSGRNLYLPIPYARSCKITFDRPNFYKTKAAEDRLYYNINYRTYKRGVRVKSLTMEDLAAAKEQIAKTAEILLDPAGNAAPSKAERATRQTTLAQGESLETNRKGPGAITKLRIRLDAPDLQQALRSTVLSMECDGERTVWCPVGDFFGSGVGLNPYKGWWRTVEENGDLTCYWVMPYKSEVSIQLKNLHAQPVKARMEVATSGWEWDNRSMHFRANWRAENSFASSKENDWNFIVAKGKGVFVGDTLALLNMSESWWGEGDEKIFVDGEKFPSHFGTGSEDYYGYAWCNPALFEAPFHAQPRADGPRNFGHVTNTRSRSLDAIPFNSSFQFDIEAWHWAKTTVSYWGTSYWYARPGATSNRPPLPERAAERVPDPAGLTRFEGENLQLRLVSAGATENQESDTWDWSGKTQLWWKFAGVGAKLEVALPVKRDGTYKIAIRETLAVDYAIVQFTLDGKNMGDPIDLYVPQLKIETLDLGQYTLEKGEHIFGATITGTNPKALKRFMVGIDYIELEKVR